MPNYKCECATVFGGDDAQRDRDIHMDSCEFVKIRKEGDLLLLQNDAMRRALTDVMQFSTDDRSKAVAKGILEAHGGPDPTCVVKRVTEKRSVPSRIGGKETLCDKQYPVDETAYGYCGREREHDGACGRE